MADFNTQTEQGTFRAGPNPQFRPANQQSGSFQVPEAGGEEKESGFLSRFGGRVKETFGAAGIKERATDIFETGKRVVKGETKPREALGQIAGKSAGEFSEFVGANIVDLLGVGAEKVGAKEPLKQKFTELLETPTGKKALGVALQGQEAWEKFKVENPNDAANVEALLGVVEFAPAGVGKKILTEAGELAVTAGKATARQARRQASNVVEVASRKLAKTRFESIQKRVAPKLTKKERELAISQGRVTRGGRTIFGGRKPDVVQVENKITRAAEIFNQRIPKAHKLDELELAKRADKEITAISKRLAPELKKVKLREADLEDALDEWDSLKTAQQESDDFLINENLFTRQQKSFEKVLLEVIDADNLNDVWDMRKAYDRSVPTNVKKATAQSESLLQFKKELWLQNRGLLNNMFDSIAEELNETARKRFDDMTALYLGRQNIIAKAKILEKGKSGIVTKKDLLKTSLGLTGVGAVGNIIF